MITETGMVHVFEQDVFALCTGAFLRGVFTYEKKTYYQHNEPGDCTICHRSDVNQQEIAQCARSHHSSHTSLIHRPKHFCSSTFQGEILFF